MAMNKHDDADAAAKRIAAEQAAAEAEATEEAAKTDNDQEAGPAAASGLHGEYSTAKDRAREHGSHGAKDSKEPRSALRDEVHSAVRDAFNAERAAGERVVEARGARYVVAHTMISDIAGRSHLAGEVVTDGHLGDGVDRMLSLGAVVPE